MQSVSNLFVGYPELIQGFNLFLPPGHKIEHEAGDQVLVRDGQPTVTYRYRGSESLSGLLEDENVSDDDHGNGIPEHSNQDSTLQASTSDSTEGWDIPVITIPDSEEPEYPEGELIVDEDSQLQEDWNLQQTPESPTNSLLPTDADERFTRNVDDTVLAMNPLIVDGFPVVHAKDPVEFGSAVSLVQTIKERFQAAGQPEKYTEFLAIISECKKRHLQLVQRQEQSYEDRQRENREVYSQVSKLLENNDDLLRSFEYHLNLPSSTNLQKPDHNLEHGTPNNSQLSPIYKPGDVERKRNIKLKRAKPPKNVVGFEPRTTQHRGPRVQGLKAKPPVRPVPKPQAIGTKRPGRPPDTSEKRQKPKPKTADLMTKEVKRMIAEMRREPTFTPEQRFKNANGMIFFSKARESLDSREAYNQFMHYLNLYMYEIISKYEFVKMVSSFVVKHPDLLKWLEDFLGIKKIVDYSVPPPPAEQVVNPQYDDVTGAQILDFDILTCKKYGPSYYVLPEGLPQPRCSGRTRLCNEVLNDTLVSSPTNYSNDEYTPVTSSKETQFDDDINETLTRIDDERFELDLVIEPNLTTMIHFEAMVRGMKRMTMKELKGFRLNDSLGGTSPIIYMNAIGRLYGNHAGSIIDAIKNNPRVAVPAVLRRIKDKSDEWRDEQRNFNIDWREQSSGKADLSEELALREVGTKRMKTTDED